MFNNIPVESIYSMCTEQSVTYARIYSVYNNIHNTRYNTNYKSSLFPVHGRKLHPTHYICIRFVQRSSDDIQVQCALLDCSNQNSIRLVTIIGNCGNSRGTVSSRPRIRELCSALLVAGPTLGVFGAEILIYEQNVCA